MKISAFKRQGLAVFEDRGGAGTRTCRAGSSTTGIDRHAGPTSTLSRRASWMPLIFSPSRPSKRTSASSCAADSCVTAPKRPPVCLRRRSAASTVGAIPFDA